MERLCISVYPPGVVKTGNIDAVRLQVMDESEIPRGTVAVVVRWTSEPTDSRTEFVAKRIVSLVDEMLRDAYGVEEKSAEDKDPPAVGGEHKQ